MDWYYAEGKDRKGPVNDTELRTLVASQTIKSDTLVWNSTMKAWTSAAQAGVISDLPPGSQICIVTGKVFPTSQMIQTEHGWVSADARDGYYQSLREGVPITAAPGVSNARADGKRVVVPIRDARLPMRCVKTNQPVTEAEMIRKKLYWCSPYVMLTILLSLIVVLILYLVLRKSMMLDIPLSAEGKRIIRKNVMIGCGITLGGLALCIVPLTLSGPAGAATGLSVAVGIITFLVGLIYISRKSAAIRVLKMKNDEAWLTGACPEFIASLPSYN